MTAAPRIVLFGPMGIGKSTAIRTLCGDRAVDCDVENLDHRQPHKATTTVGADYGVIRLEDNQELHIYGSPGQERFAFMREWLMSLAIGAVVMTDLASANAVSECAALIREMESFEAPPTTIVVVARPATEHQITSFSEALAEVVGWPVPTLLADVREREQMLNVLSVLVAMLSVENEPLAGGVET